MIGNVASNAADCMQVAASRPRREEREVDTPPSAAVESPLSTYEPSPRPIAARNRIGVRNEVKIVERNVRRYWQQPVLEDVRHASRRRGRADGVR